MFSKGKSKPKIREAERNQVRMVMTDLEAMVPANDPVRAVWAFVEKIDLSPFYDRIVSEEGGVGRPAIDPKILFALWLQATLDGVGSARELARLCEQHIRYQWICGGVIPNYHTLSDFRSNSADALDRVLTKSIAVLLNENLVQMDRVAQDGMRVRASAGASSFRRGKTLTKLYQIAEEQVKVLKKELDQDPGAGKRREQAANERAAQSRLKRIERALKQLPDVEKRKRSKNGKPKTEARVSTTDPDARVMKMADGGFRPAYNVQYAGDTIRKCVVGVTVTNDGTDLRSMKPMIDQIEQRHGKVPPEWLIDGGYILLEEIDAAAKRGCAVYGPPRKPRADGHTPTEVRWNDSEGVAAWRNRMASEHGQCVYRERGATAELINAQARTRGLTQFLVRGLERVRSVALLHALAQNLSRTQSFWLTA